MPPVYLTREVMEYERKSKAEGEWNAIDQLYAALGHHNGSLQRQSEPTGRNKRVGRRTREN